MGWPQTGTFRGWKARPTSRPRKGGPTIGDYILCWNQAICFQRPPPPKSSKAQTCRPRTSRRRGEQSHPLHTGSHANLKFAAEMSAHSSNVRFSSRKSIDYRKVARHCMGGSKTGPLKAECGLTWRHIHRSIRKIMGMECFSSATISDFNGHRCFVEGS
jgi:hypothetical protein